MRKQCIELDSTHDSLSKPWLSIFWCCLPCEGICGPSPTKTYLTAHILSGHVKSADGLKSLREQYRLGNASSPEPLRQRQALAINPPGDSTNGRRWGQAATSTGMKADAKLEDILVLKENASLRREIERLLTCVAKLRAALAWARRDAAFSSHHAACLLQEVRELREANMVFEGADFGLGTHQI
eukprot:jgi/Botrbrau1/987/Bobra.114_1s0027.1